MPTDLNAKRMATIREAAARSVEKLAARRAFEGSIRESVTLVQTTEDVSPPAAALAIDVLSLSLQRYQDFGDHPADIRNAVMLGALFVSSALGGSHLDFCTWLRRLAMCIERQGAERIDLSEIPH